MNGAWQRIDEGSWVRLVLDLPGEKVNVLRRDNMQELRALLEDVARSDARAVTLESGKSGGFIAGADIQAIAHVTDPKEGEEAAVLGQEIFAVLEALPMPTVALIHGACVGGGLELALACDLRVASSDPSTQLGLPEVMLGILPGFGGTQRLPRLLGLVSSLPLLLTGKLLAPRAALAAGLVDAVVEPLALRAAAERLVSDGGSRRKPRRGRLLECLLRWLPPLRWWVLQRARKSVLHKTGGNYPAPLAILDAVEAGYARRRKAAFAAEARLLGELIVSPVSKNLVRLFKLSEEARSVAEGAPPIERAMVVGAGTMGAGIATLFAGSGVRTRWFDASGPALAAGMQKATDALTRKGKKRGGSAAVQALLDRLEPTTTLAGLGRQQLFLEAVIEDMAVKQELLAAAEAGLPEDAILATNTSSLDLDEMASALADPSRLVGIHFFHPVHRMRLVEIVRGAHTSPESVEAARALVRRLGKVPIVVGNAAGFLVNRLLTPYLLEAEQLVHEGYSVQDIDRGMRRAGMPMGPFELLDEVGLDVATYVSGTMQAAFPERFPSAGVVGRLRERGCLGKKSGSGFYRYGKKRRVNPLVENPAPKQYEAGPVEERLILPVVAEGLRCIDEGIVPGEDTVDLGMLLGTGFLLPDGGPMNWARKEGWRNIHAGLVRLQQVHGERFAVPAGLDQRLQQYQGAGT